MYFALAGNLVQKSHMKTGYVNAPLSLSFKSHFQDSAFSKQEMQAVFVIAFTLFSGVMCSDLPKFSWDEHNLLRITFPDGRVDFAELEPHEVIPRGPEERPEDVDGCIYHGYLKQETDVYVSVTGCAQSNNFLIQFRSRHLNGSMFKVENGNVEKILPIFGQTLLNDRYGTTQMYRDGLIRPPKPALRAPTVESDPNPKGYNLQIQVLIDDAFKSKFGNDCNNAVRRIFAQAQYFWRMRTSLGTKIEFVINPIIQQIPGKHVADSDLESVSVNSKNASMDSFVYLTFRNNTEGVLGRAYFATTCSPDVIQRSCICEYIINDIISGLVVAHEIGHNLGMEHDFANEDPSQKRYDSKGKLCTGVGGVMDYGTKMPDLWSTCSVEDFKKYFNQQNPFCLKQL